MYHRSPYVCYPCDRSCIRVVVAAVPDVCNIKHILIVTNKPESHLHSLFFLDICWSIRGRWVNTSHIRTLRDGLLLEKKMKWGVFDVGGIVRRNRGRGTAPMVVLVAWNRAAAIMVVAVWRRVKTMMAMFQVCDVDVHCRAFTPWAL